MPRRADLTNEQNERVRAILHEYIEQLRARGEKATQVMLAPRIGLQQAALSKFLDGTAGMTRATLERLSRVLGRPTWEIIGDEPPELTLPPRALATLLVKPFGVSDELIAEVLAEPMTAESEPWPPLVWANHILALHFQRLVDRALCGGSHKAKEPGAMP